MQIGGFIFAAFFLGSGIYVLLAGTKQIDIWNQFDDEKKAELFAKHGQTLRTSGVVLIVVGLVLLAMKIVSLMNE